MSEVPQGSISAELLFNISSNDLLIFVGNSDFGNYADGDTLYSSGNNLEQVK